MHGGAASACPRALAAQSDRWLIGTREGQATGCRLWALRNETLQQRGLPDSSRLAPCLYRACLIPTLVPSPRTSFCRSAQSWPGHEPRGGPREESGGRVRSAEGPGAAHAEKDGIERECCAVGDAPQPPGGAPAAGRAKAVATACGRRGRGGGMLSL